MYRQPWLFVLALAAGVLLGALAVSTWPERAPAADTHAKTPAERALEDLPKMHGSEPAAIESLAGILNAEINERRVLTEQLEQLRAELRDLEQNLRVRVEEAFDMDEDSRVQESDAAVAQTQEERLVAAGFTRQQLAAIDRLQARTRMAWIELDDRARREGWIDTPRYYEESRALTSGSRVIRESLGDELYDRYLYESGLPNRIAVASIVETSPAQAAGFQPGDVVVTYAGENVYSSEQLVELRSSGVRGEPVHVEVVRNGELLQLTIPRGPMGLSMTPTSVDPTDY